MLVTLNEVLKKAREGHYAVPAFDCNDDILIRTILDTAEEKKSPVILMVLEHDLKGKGMKYITSMVNLYADLRIALMEGIKKSVELQKRVDPLPDQLFKPAVEVLRDKVIEKIKMVMSENRA